MKSFLKSFDTIILIILNFLFLILLVEMNIRLESNFFLIKKNFLYIFFLILINFFYYLHQLRFLNYNIFFIFLILVFFNYFIKGDHFGTSGYLTNLEYAEEKGIKFDNRTKLQFYEDIKKTKNISSTITNWDVNQYQSKYKESNKNLFPISNGIADLDAVYCNENGKWQFLYLDKYGFPNKNNVYVKNKYYDIILLGDSFTKGSCVDLDKRPANILQERFSLDVLNLANAGGFLSSYAAYKEYGVNFNSKYVILNFYEGNDYSDTLGELNTYLSKYLEKDYNQNLIERQSEINKFYEKILFQSLDGIKYKKKIPEFIKLISLYNLNNFFKRILFKIKLNYFSEKEIFIVNEISRILNNMNELVEKNNSKLIINILPTWDRYHSNNSKNENFRSIKQFKEIFESKNITYLDMNEFVLQRIEDPKTLYTFDRFNHFDEDGYLLMSEFIFKKLFNN